MLGLILTLAIVGFVLWLVETYVPMPPPFKLAIRVIVLVVLILWLLRLFGVADLPIPRVR